MGRQNHELVDLMDNVQTQKTPTFISAFLFYLVAPLWLKEQFTLILKFQSSFTVFTLMLTEKSSTKHFWSFAVKKSLQRSSKQLKQMETTPEK